jgi:altronate dehydratase
LPKLAERVKIKKLTEKYIYQIVLLLWREWRKCKMSLAVDIANHLKEKIKDKDRFNISIEEIMLNYKCGRSTAYDVLRILERELSKDFDVIRIKGMLIGKKK